MRLFFLLAFMFLLPFFGYSKDQKLTNHDSSLPIEITADSLEVLQSKKQAIFLGKVEAKQGNLNIRSDQMIVHYVDKDKKEKNEDSLKQNSVSKIVANGNVFLSAPKESAKSNVGVYDVKNEIVTLTGNVILSSGKNILKGNKMIYDIQKGSSKMVGSDKNDKSSSKDKPQRVRGVFIPGN